jgi:ribosome-binding factor A
MPREFTRNERVGPLIQRQLADLLQKKVNDPRLAITTITEVMVSPDLSHARVYVTFLEADDVKNHLAILNNAAGFLRTELGRRVKLRFIPQLSFCYDASVERGSYLAKKIDEAVEKDAEIDHSQDDSLN